MSMHYVTDAQARDPHTLPSVLVSQFTAHEIAETMEDEVYAFMRRPQFRMANMNSRDRERLLDAMVDELEITGGYMWAVCLPGCLPDSDWSGPFSTEQEALDDARSVLAED